MLASIPSPSSSVIELGPLDLRAYGLMIALGVIAAVLVSQRRWAARGGNPDDITFSVGGASTTLDAPDVSGGTALALGASFTTGGNGLKGRFEVSHDADDNTSWGIKLGIEF